MADTISMDLDDLDDVVEVPLEDPVLDPVEQGEIQKKLGNERYLSQDYRGALVCYNKAIDWCPANAAYYGNRAACLIMMKDFFGALIDSKKAVTLNPTYFKGYNRIAKCAVAVGDLSTAETAIQRGLELEPGNSTFDNEKQSIETLRRHMEDARKSEAQGDFRRVLYCMDRCLEIAVSCVNFKLVKAESLVKLGRMLEGEELANEVLLRDRNNVEAIYVRGLSLYYQDSMDKALQHFQAVLRLAPDLQKAKDAYKRCKLLTQTKEEGNTIYNEGRLAEALEAYNRALQIDPLNKATNAKIYFNRATVYVKLNRLQETIADCTKALELQPEYQKPLLRRAKTYIALEMYQEAVADYETAYNMDKSREIKRMLNDAKMALKRSKRKDYYKILGVNRDASEDEIKKAYKRRALEHHPDRHSHASEAEKKEQEVKFKEVGEAYGVLLDPKKRARYDNGQDLDDDFDGHGHGFSTMDATNLFNAFYGGGVPRDGFTFQSPGSFPAGFSFHFN